MINAIYLVLGAAFIFILAYRYYGAFIAARVLALDDSRRTPAHRLKDGRDFVPTNKFIVFGHHFAAIAGAGPLIGPVLAAQFGFAPGFFWILAGAVLAGAVHDLVILFASLRHNGTSLAEIARAEVSQLTGFIAALAKLFIIVIALAGFAIVVVAALQNNVWGTFSIAFTIPAAILIGLYIHYLRPGKVFEASIIGFVLVVAGVLLGPYVRESGLATWFMFSETQIKLLLPAYGFIASVLPVWLLLCPRDYLSSFLKIGMILLLAAGVIFLAPNIQMPAVTPFIHGGGPNVNGPLWPFLFITIACGAISGFHSLISSGVTPKIINAEKDLRLIGYGAMVMEGFVAMIALIAACVLMPGDYFAINSTAEVFRELEATGNPLFQTVNLEELSAMVQLDLAGRPGGAVSLAAGMTNILAALPFLKGAMAFLFQFCILFEALFILTAIDTGTRVARYMLQDMLGHFYAPMKKLNWLPGTIFCSLIISLSWGYLIYGGTISTIWPVFGVSNQLLATMALAIGTSFILRRTKKLSYALITLLPMAFVGVTAVTAGIMSVFNTHIPGGMFLNAALIVILIILILGIIIDSMRSWVRYLSPSFPVYVDPVDSCQREVS